MAFSVKLFFEFCSFLVFANPLRDVLSAVILSLNL